MENGRANISLDNADAIAGALGVALAVLLIDYEQEK
jgi:transcriptional regulator with XRE-family HTH domain